MLNKKLFLSNTTDSPYVKLTIYYKPVFLNDFITIKISYFYENKQYTEIIGSPYETEEKTIELNIDKNSTAIISDSRIMPPSGGTYYLDNLIGCAYSYSDGKFTISFTSSNAYITIIYDSTTKPLP